MVKKDERTKRKYESPTVVALGELARGSGACSAGSGDSWDCTAGGSATNACTAGTSATAACTAGSIIV